MVTISLPVPLEGYTAVKEMLSSSGSCEPKLAPFPLRPILCRRWWPLNTRSVAATLRMLRLPPRGRDTVPPPSLPLTRACRSASISSSTRSPAGSAANARVFRAAPGRGYSRSLPPSIAICAINSDTAADLWAIGTAPAYPCVKYGACRRASRSAPRARRRSERAFENVDGVIFSVALTGTETAQVVDCVRRTETTPAVPGPGHAGKRFPSGSA